ncbi:hypothetical protein ACLMJK_001696 [Lecanora helva]
MYIPPTTLLLLILLPLTLALALPQYPTPYTNTTSLPAPISISPPPPTTKPHTTFEHNAIAAALAAGEAAIREFQHQSPAAMFQRM